MSFKSALILALIAVAWIMASCTRQETNSAGLTADNDDSYFYAREGRQVNVQFSAAVITPYKSIEEFTNAAEINQRWLEDSYIPRILMFLQGPLAYRGIGSRRINAVIKVNPGSIRMTRSGLIAFDYSYEASWLLSNKIKAAFQIPVPFNITLLKTEKWLKCLDQAPEHKNDTYFWYYWDPSRKDCDQKQGPHYQMANVQFTEAGTMQTQSYPDYEKLLKSAGVDKNMQMTFAFGYVKTPENPDPFVDQDYNMQNFRKVLEHFRTTARILNFQETPILQSEYLEPVRPEQRIGSRFVGTRNGNRFEIKLVAAGDLKAVQLFAQSYAHDHDGFFSWYGHSQVGTEWEIQQFANLLEDYPEYYTLTKDYQIIYWAGCTSYTYYTTKLFKMKADLDPENDPNGTKALDIVTNGYATLFTPFVSNAMTWFGSLINWDMQTSYQTIISTLEQTSTESKQVILVNVLGDEDNPKTAKF